MGKIVAEPQTQPTAQNKVQFDVNARKENFFDIRDMLNRNTGNFPIYEMPPGYGITFIPKSLRKVSTLENFLACCLSLAKDPNVLAKIEILLDQ